MASRLEEIMARVVSTPHETDKPITDEAILAFEIMRLNVLLDKYPTTYDDVAIYPNMEAFAFFDGELESLTVIDVGQGLCTVECKDGEVQDINPELIISTREAAMAAISV